MVITYKTLHKVKFPIFLLYTGEWERADGLLFIEGKVVDDTNMPGGSMGIRRMQSSYPDLYKLKKAIQNHNGILKQTTKYFIDSSGFPFMYMKTKFFDLKYLKITEVIRKDTASHTSKRLHYSFYRSTPSLAWNAMGRDTASTRTTVDALRVF